MLSDPNSQPVMNNPQALLLFEPFELLIGGDDISVLAAKNSRVLKARFPARALIDLQSVNDSDMSEPLRQPSRRPGEGAAEPITPVLEPAQR
jgi:hypothetical protein